jgi:hypothetical protein
MDELKVKETENQLNDFIKWISNNGYENIVINDISNNIIKNYLNHLRESK